jgi:hypothetical protein
MKSKIQRMFEPSRSILKGRIWAGWGWLHSYVPRSKLVRKVRDKAKKGGEGMLCRYRDLLRIELFNMGIIGGWATAMGVHGLESKYPKETRTICREINKALKDREKAGAKDPLDSIWFRKMTGWEGGLSKKEVREMKALA